MKKITLFIMDVGVLDQRFSLSECLLARKISGVQSRLALFCEKQKAVVSSYSGNPAIYSYSGSCGVSVMAGGKADFKIP